jgi:hypothetical protein
MTLSGKEKTSNTQKNNSHQLPKPFHEYKDKKIWLASDENKKPVSPITGESKGWNLPAAWGTYSDLEKYLTSKPDHIPAIALSKECELVAFDLDNAVDSNGKILSWAQAIIARLESGSYIEKSSSNKGFHIYAKGSKPGLCKVKSYPNGGKLEIYDSNKVMRLTGSQCGICDNLVDMSPTIADIYHALFPEDENQDKERPTYKKSPPLKDEDIIALCRKAANAPKFKSLYDEGKIDINDPSASEMSLCSILAFYTQDLSQLDKLVRESKLFETAKKCRIEKGSKQTDKWEREDYRQRTIQNVLSNLNETYQGHSSEQVKETQTPLLKPLGLSTFLTMKIPQRPFILPWCREQNTCMIHAWRGVGKTLFSLNVAYAIASGGNFLDWQVTNPRKVLYIDGEMPAIALQERLSNIVKRNKGTTPANDDYFQILASDTQDLGIPFLDTIEGQVAIQPFVDKADVIILDNLSTLTCQPENDAQSWIPMQQWVLAQRRAGKTVILIHHSGKTGAQRGNSKREDILDVVISLRRPNDYTPEQGARFELHFEKTRGISGKQVAPLEINVEERDGILHWIHKELEIAILLRIKDFVAMGMTEREIVNELSISRATFYRYKKKIVEQTQNNEF